LHQLLLPEQCDSEIGSLAALQAMQANVRPCSSQPSSNIGCAQQLGLFSAVLKGCLVWKAVQSVLDSTAYRVCSS